MSFKVKTILIFLCVSVIPYITSLVIFGTSFKIEQQTAIVKDMDSELSKVIQNINIHLLSIKKDSYFLSSSDIMNDIYTNDIDKRISNLLLSKKISLAIDINFYVINKDKNIIASSDFNTIGTKYNENSFLELPILSKLTKEKIGTLCIKYNVNNLQKFFINTSTSMYLINENKKINIKYIESQYLFTEKKVDELKNISIILEINKDYAFRLINKYSEVFILFLIIGIGIISLIAYYFATTLIKPIIELSSMAKEITKNKNYGKKIKHLHKEDEISTLYKSFNSLLDSVKTSLNTEKKLNEEIEKTQKEIIFTMATVAEGRSKETGNHVKRVAEYSTLLAKYYGLSKETCELIRMASPMHDIGKIAIPDNILKKPGLLTDEERIIMNKHAEYGFNMLKHSDRPLIKMASIIALEHHEKYNGTGYPKGLEGEQINIEARITAIADVFDALGSDRVYKKAWEDEKIFNLFKNERGKHFDPKLIDLFFENIDEFLSIRESLKDDVNEKNIYDLA